MSFDLLDDPDGLKPFRIFIREEVRERLLQHQEAARAAVARWVAATEAQMARRDEWLSRRDEYMRGVLAAQADRGETTDPGPCPGDGFEYVQRWPDEAGDYRWVNAWVPREVIFEADPVWGGMMPLPVPDDRDVPPDARWAALVALHDACRVPEERIGPTGSRAYGLLEVVAVGEPADLIPALRAWLVSLTTPDPTAPTPPAADQSPQVQVFFVGVATNPDAKPALPDSQHEPAAADPITAPGSAAVRPAPEPPAAVNSVRRTGTSWIVQFGDEEGVFPLKGWSVLEHVAAAIARPGEPVQVCDTPGAKDDVADGPTLAAVRRERDTIQNELAENSRAREANQHDPAMQRECDEKFEQLQARLQQVSNYLDGATRPGGRRKKLGADGPDRDWDSIRNLLKALPQRLREQAKMPMLADHLQRALLPAKPYLTYNPPLVAAPWSVEV